MYPCFEVYHEMDFSQIIARFEELYAEKSVLALLLEQYHYLLTHVAKETKIPYATLSAWKKRQRDIKKSRRGHGRSLSKILPCPHRDSSGTPKVPRNLGSFR